MWYRRSIVLRLLNKRTLGIYAHSLLVRWLKVVEMELIATCSNLIESSS